MNFHFPLVLSGTSAVLIVAALCGLVGLSLFFRGFSLAQRRSHEKPSTPKLASSSMHPAAIVAARGPQTLETTLKTEVIRLSSDEAPAAVSMSQQGKIAAALLKAGVPSPASWGTEPGAGVDIATSRVQNPSTLQTTKLRVTESASPQPANAVKDDSRKAAAARRSKNNTGAWMLWMGIALVVLSVYLIAAHFGWL